MKNGMGVQKTGLEYFDNRNRLKSQVGYLQVLTSSLTNSLSFNIHGSISMAKIIFPQK